MFNPFFWKTEEEIKKMVEPTKEEVNFIVDYIKKYHESKFSDFIDYIKKYHFKEFKNNFKNIWIECVRFSYNNKDNEYCRMILNMSSGKGFSE